MTLWPVTAMRCGTGRKTHPLGARRRRYRKKTKVMTDSILKRWAWQILAGLVYLHGHVPPIVHRWGLICPGDTPRHARTGCNRLLQV